MAIRLGHHYGGRSYGKYHLVCDDADRAQIQAGKDWFAAEKSAYFARTRDGWMINFRNISDALYADMVAQGMSGFQAKLTWSEV